MTTKTSEFLAEQKRLAEAATEGPWEADGCEVSQHWSRPEPWLPIATNEVACMAYCYGGSARGIEREADAEFIAAARETVPRLVAALEVVMREVEAYARQPDVMEPCGAVAQSLRLAIDDALGGEGDA